MRIAVLDLTEECPELLAGLPRVADQIISWLQPALPDGAYTGVDVSGGANLPQTSSFDGVILSGSEYGVYDSPPWMAPLRDFLVEVKQAGKPVFGICFGHQIMADVWGGKAEKAAVGNTVGARAFQMGDDTLEANVWHQDQVTKAPPNAEVIATTGYCPIGALAYDFPALSVQFHPEYTQSHLNEVFDRAEGVFLSAKQIAEARSSFAQSTVAPDLMAAHVAEFFKTHAPV